MSSENRAGENPATEVSMSEQYNPLQALEAVVTVKECQQLFKIRDQKTVIMACLTGRLTCRKADAEIGVRGGVWLIDLSSAKLLWGYRNERPGKPTF